MHVDDHQAKHGRSAASRTYALGHTTDEFKRLERQDMYYRELTETFLLRAGLAPGMRVPDIGGGGGDVALMAARLVGPSGSVLGTDRSAAAVALATRRAAEAGESGVKFSVCELDALPTRPLFDAVIGRFILMYLPNPAGLLKRVCRCLRPGGIVAFQEHVMQLSRSVPELPLRRKCAEWIIETFERTGTSLDMGGNLYATFLAADLPAARLMMERPWKADCKRPTMITWQGFSVVCCHRQSGLA